MSLDPGAACPRSGPLYACILGSGGGLAIRGGYRSPGPWYFGGAYQFTKMDSSNLYRLGIFQQLRAEMRYLPDIGYRAAPYFSAGIGGVAYGNEWGVETGGALIFGGVGVELEVSRRAVLGVSCVYRPVLLAGWRTRPTTSGPPPSRNSSASSSSSRCGPRSAGAERFPCPLERTHRLLDSTVAPRSPRQRDLRCVRSRQRWRSDVLSGLRSAAEGSERRGSSRRRRRAACRRCRSRPCPRLRRPRRRPRTTPARPSGRRGSRRAGAPSPGGARVLLQPAQLGEDGTGDAGGARPRGGRIAPGARGRRDAGCRRAGQRDPDGASPASAEGHRAGRRARASRDALDHRRDPGALLPELQRGEPSGLPLLRDVRRAAEQERWRSAGGRSTAGEPGVEARQGRARRARRRAPPWRAVHGAPAARGDRDDRARSPRRHARRAPARASGGGRAAAGGPRRALRRRRRAATGRRAGQAASAPAATGRPAPGAAAPARGQRSSADKIVGSPVVDIASSQRAPVPPVECARCRGQCLAGTRFCKYCGAPLEGERPASERPARPATDRPQPAPALASDARRDPQRPPHAAEPAGPISTEAGSAPPPSQQPLAPLRASSRLARRRGFRLTPSRPERPRASSS